MPLQKSSKTKIIFKIILFFFTFLYPFALYFKSQYIQYLIFIMVFLWALNIFFANDIANKALGAFLSFVFIGILIFQNNFLLYLYPVFVNLFMLILFSFSLKNTAIITKIALLKEPNLPLSGIIYTRNLTKIWSIFFLINGFIAFGLIFLEDKSYWTLYTGVISYILVGLFFAVELIVRYFYQRRVDA